MIVVLTIAASESVLSTTNDIFKKHHVLNDIKARKGCTVLVQKSVGGQGGHAKMGGGVSALYTMKPHIPCSWLVLVPPYGLGKRTA